MHPHLQVRPIATAMAVLLGTVDGFRPAATLTFQPKRQSKRDLQRNIDNARRRADDWMRLSAEPALLGSFPSYAASSTKTFPLVGSLPPGQEVRELQIVLEGTLKINAGTGQIQAADYNIIGVALYSKIRASLYGQNDAFNLTYPEARSINFVFDSRDVAQQDPNTRIGTGLTTTAFPFKAKIKIPFCYRALEVPEIFSPCSDQINLPGSKLDLDTNGSALTTVALTSGAGTVTVSDVKVYAIMNQVPMLHAGPPIVYRSKAIAQTVDTEFGQGCDLFVAAEEAATATGGGARVQQWTVRRDGRAQPLNVDPVTLGQQFNESNFSIDALSALDITNGVIPRAGVATATQPVPDAAIGTQAGAVLTPLLWVDGRVRAGAWQWPYWTASRTLWANLVAGQSPSATILYAQVRPVYECQGQIVNLASANGVPIGSVDELRVRGGNDGDVNKLFKGRLLMRKSSGKAAA